LEGARLARLAAGGEDGIAQALLEESTVDVLGGGELLHVGHGENADITFSDTVPSSISPIQFFY